MSNQKIYISESEVSESDISENEFLTSDDESVEFPDDIEIESISENKIDNIPINLEINNNKFIKDIDIKDNINITFVGEINAGKSSLINSLIGDDLLSVGIRRTTLSNTSVIRTSVLEQNYEHNNYLYLSKSNRLDIFFKDNKVSLIDTIGLNDPCKDKEQYEWFNKNLDKSDIVFFVTSYEKCFSTESEQNAFKKIYSQINEMNKNDHNICLAIIITKIDTKNSDKEYKKQVKEVNNFLKSLNLEKEFPIVHIWNKELLLSRQIIELNKNIDSIQKLGVMDIKNLKDMKWFSKYGGEELKKVINKFLKDEWKSLDHAKECKSKYLMNMFINKYKNNDEYEIPVYDFLNLLKDIKTSYLKPYLEKIKLCYEKFNFNEIIENNNILKKIHNFGYYLNNFSKLEKHIFRIYVFNELNNLNFEMNLAPNVFNTNNLITLKNNDNFVEIDNKYVSCKDLDLNNFLKLKVSKGKFYNGHYRLIDLYKQKYNEDQFYEKYQVNLKKRSNYHNFEIYYGDYKELENYEDKLYRNENNKYFRIYDNENYTLDKEYCLSSDYNLEDIEKYEELFKKIYKYELLKDKDSILRKYLQFKLEKLINMKVYYDQLYNLNVEKYDELREIFGLIFKSPPKLEENDDILKLEENKLNFTDLEKFIVDKLREHNVQKSEENDKNFTDLEKLIVDKLEEYKLSVKNVNKKCIKTNKNEVNVNKDDIIVLLDRENVTNKESNYLISNYNVRSYRTNNYKLRNRVKSEKDIVVKNLGKNTVDFNIVKDAQKYLSETDKYVVVYTHDHFGEVLDENDRYLNTGDYKMIELYFNIKSNKEVINVV